MLIPRIVLALLASGSIASLLLYFSGAMSMRAAVSWVCLPSMIALGAAFSMAPRTSGLRARLVAGVWAGGFATLAYDIARIPVAHAGIPVFKAISYFGTLILQVPRPTLASEIAGWSYHVSNGIGFALMYTLLVRKPGPVTAVIWGMVLEAAMLVTPYAEIFGYRLSAGFLGISIGAHIVYGATLWIAARLVTPSSKREPLVGAGHLGLTPLMVAAWLMGPAGIALTAADFHRGHAASIPASPPPYIGPDLYVTWNASEPDRIGAIWLMSRYVNPRARFHFIEPMSQPSYGTPFDLPEAEIRRYHNRSTFEVMLERAGLKDDPIMILLARMCYVTEIRPWTLAAAEEERLLAEDLGRRLGTCDALTECLDRGLAWFDETYERLKGTRAAPPGS